MTTSDSARAARFEPLRQCSLFGAIAPDAFDQIAAMMDVVTAPRGRLMMQNGDLTSEVFFLISGSAIGQLVAGNGRQFLFTEIKRANTSESLPHWMARRARSPFPRIPIASSRP